MRVCPTHCSYFPGLLLYSVSVFPSVKPCVCDCTSPQILRYSARLKINHPSAHRNALIAHLSIPADQISIEYIIRRAPHSTRVKDRCIGFEGSFDLILIDKPAAQCWPFEVMFSTHIRLFHAALNLCYNERFLSQGFSGSMFASLISLTRCWVSQGNRAAIMIQ